MNKVILIGRLTRDAEIRVSGETKTARYSLAVNRMKPDEADFINCVAFNKAADFAEKYLKKGTKILVEGRIQTGSYTNKDGQKVYTTDVIVDRHEFVEKAGASTEEATKPAEKSDDSFMSIPEGFENDGLPFV